MNMVQQELKQYMNYGNLRMRLERKRKRKIILKKMGLKLRRGKFLQITRMFMW